MNVLTTRIDLVPESSGNTVLLLLGHLKKRISDRLQFTRTGTAVLFAMPPGLGALEVAEAMEGLDPELKAVVKRINLFEDDEQEVHDEGRRVAQHG
jgi:hypothetical protein